MSDLWKELNDVSMYDKHIPCALCKQDAVPTVTLTRYKCSKCDHLFNEDKSTLPENIICYCENCSPREQTGSLEDRGKGKAKRVLEKVKNTIKKVTKKVKKG